MKRVINLTVLVASLAILGCTKEQNERQAIVLSANIESQESNVTKADTYPFPNSGKIVVVGVFSATENAYRDAASGEWIVDWRTNNRYIDNIPATTATAPETTEGNYYFEWDSGDYYWPLTGMKMDGNVDITKLTFFAYSPAAITGKFTVTPGTADDKKSELTMDMTLPALDAGTKKQDMPDIMYSDKSTADKANQSVNFGTFRHALSQVSVKLVPSNVSPNVELTKFEIELSENASLIHHGTLYNTATPSVLEYPTLTYSTSTITYSYNATDVAPVSISNGSTIYLNSGMASTGTPFFVFPDDSNAKVRITLKDNTNAAAALTTTYEYGIGDFLSDGQTTGITQGAEASLTRAANILLTINITGNEIGVVSSSTTTLTATLEPWVEKGNFKINIE